MIPHAIPIALGVAALGGLGYWWYKSHQPAPSTGGNALYGAANSVAQYLQTNGCAPDGTVGGNLANLQSIWNSSGGTPQVQVDDKYGPCSQALLASILGSAPAPCIPGTCTGGQYTPPAGGGGGGGSTSVPSGGGGPSGGTQSGYDQTSYNAGYNAGMSDAAYGAYNDAAPSNYDPTSYSAGYAQGWAAGAPASTQTSGWGYAGGYDLASAAVGAAMGA